jgi:DNA-binding NarL/FixJ family response regulator
MNSLNITPRERMILKLLGKGCTYQQIAQVLFISVDTVKKHVQNTYRKLDAKNKIEALNAWNRLKVITESN